MNKNFSKNKTKHIWLKVYQPYKNSFCIFLKFASSVKYSSSKIFKCIWSTSENINTPLIYSVDKHFWMPTTCQTLPSVLNQMYCILWLLQSSFIYRYLHFTQILPWSDIATWLNQLNIKNSVTVRICNIFH